MTADGGASSDDDKNFQALIALQRATYNTMCNMQHADCKMQRTACSGDKQGELTRVPSFASRALAAALQCTVHSSVVTPTGA
jgi:hypothetical protein